MSKEELVDELIRLIVGDAEYSDTSLIEGLRRELMMVPEKRLIALMSKPIIQTLDDDYEPSVSPRDCAIGGEEDSSWT